MRCHAVVLAALAWLISVECAEARLEILVDKGSQRMMVMEDGYVRYLWPISTGRDQMATPSGVYVPQRLERNWFSKEYYDSPMPFAIFFHNGYAIHGSYAIDKLGGPASHGCVRLHPHHAEMLFDLVQQEGPGNTVIEVADQAQPDIASVLPRDMSPREMPPREMPPRDMPPPEMLSREMPPRDMSPRDLPRDLPPRDMPSRVMLPREMPPRDFAAGDAVLPRDVPPGAIPSREFMPPRDIPVRDMPPRRIPLRDVSPREAPPPRGIPLRELPPREISPRDVVLPRDVPPRNLPLRDIPPPHVIEADRGLYPPAPRPVRYREAPDVADLPPAPAPRASRPQTRNALAPKPPDRRRMLSELSPPPATVPARPPVVASDATTAPARPVDESVDNRFKQKVAQAPPPAPAPEPAKPSRSSELTQSSRKLYGFKVLPASCWSGSGTRWRLWGSGHDAACNK